MRAAIAKWSSGGTYMRYKGNTVFCEQGGAGPKLLLIHGTPFGAFDWHAAWPYLCDCFNILAPDLPGMGLSSSAGVEAGSVTALWADYLEHLTSSVGWTNFYVVAHGLGVQVAQELLARDLQSRVPSVSGAVFLNGLVFPEMWRPTLRERLLQSHAGAWLSLRGQTSTFDQQMKALFGTVSPPTDDLANDLLAIGDVASFRSYRHRIGLEASTSLPHRHRLIAPMLDGRLPLRFVSGEADKQLGHKMAQRYKELAPQADVVRLAEVGHWPQLEVPRLVVGYIAQKLLYSRRRSFPASSAAT